MALHVSPVGLLLLCVYCLISGLSAVYTEAILKSQALPLSLQNIFLYFFGVLLNLAGSVWSGTEGGFLQGFSPWVLLVVLSQALNGLIMSVVMKHSSNITRLFVISCSILVNPSPCLEPCSLQALFPLPGHSVSAEQTGTGAYDNFHPLPKFVPSFWQAEATQGIKVAVQRYLCVCVLCLPALWDGGCAPWDRFGGQGVSEPETLMGEGHPL
uniref:Solute carrier family 35 member A4 n=1 Tax=Zosterops lateralis melanops TaxID=1220523 RepID=A0A8D2PUW7_ZOSLA